MIFGFPLFLHAASKRWETSSQDLFKHNAFLLIPFLQRKKSANFFLIKFTIKCSFGAAKITITKDNHFLCKRFIKTDLQLLCEGLFYIYADFFLLFLSSSSRCQHRRLLTQNIPHGQNTDQQICSIQHDDQKRRSPPWKD